MSRPGFTLVEVLVASSIAGFVTLVAMGSLHALSLSSSRIQVYCDATSELRYAVSVLSRDLDNLYVGDTPNSTKLEFLDEGMSRLGVPTLTFYMVGHDRARIAQPEGDIYEVEYYLAQTEDRSMLMRRLWPNPAREAEPGGVLTVLSEGIGVFKIRFHDGKEWQYQWTQEQQGLPKLIEVMLSTKTDNTNKPLTTSFMVKPMMTSSDNNTTGQTEEAGGSEPLTLDSLNTENEPF
ncbi:MAG: prepilin-type N-terminal cleavage/methylation domain-containing protein [Phycisphaeraceae bacterium]|nr:prepilin-type N-terminal cleavage/methylation domain-containing protein [Phycisphaeraceae bacterium]